jgi:hypothetical protein
MSKVTMEQPHHQHVHIDNGGISMSIVDKGVEQGVWFELSTEYYGYPGLHASMQVDQHTEEFLNKMEALIKAARQDLKGIDWEKRYNTNR